MNERAMPERNPIGTGRIGGREREKKKVAVENQPFIYLPPNADLSRSY